MQEAMLQGQQKDSIIKRKNINCFSTLFPNTKKGILQKRIPFFNSNSLKIILILITYAMQA